MPTKMLSAVALFALLATGCAATVPVTPAPDPAAAAPTAPPLQGIADADLAALSDAQFAALSDQQIAALTQSQIDGLSPSRLQAMTPSQRVALILAQFSSLTLPQIKALPPALFAALTPSQLQTLPPVQAQALTTEQLAALSTEQAAAVAAAAAAPEDTSGPDKTTFIAHWAPPPPNSGGLATPTTAPSAPGLHVQVMDGAIVVLNQGGALGFQAGQFGYVPSMNQPPVIVPPNPGIQFVPPPVFNTGSPTAGSGAGQAVDCVVRYTALQTVPVTQVVNNTVTLINSSTSSAPTSTTGSTSSSTTVSTDTKSAGPAPDTTGVKNEKPAAKTYCN